MIEPWRNKRFTDPRAVARYAARGLAPFVMQEFYITQVCGLQKSIFCCSHQARTGLRVMACMAVNHNLMFHLHKKELGKDWGDGSSLANCNADVIEGIHSEERCCHVASGGAGVGITAKTSCEAMSRVQAVYDHKSFLIQEGGLDVGCGRHKASRDKVNSMGNSLGAFEEEALWRYGPASNKIPEDYVEFLQQMEDAFKAGWDQGCKDYSDKFPEVLTQFEEKGVAWGVLPNEVYPTEFAPVTPQDLKALKPLLPEFCIDHSALAISDKDKKRELKALKALEEERARVAACGDSDVEEAHERDVLMKEANMSTRLANLVADAEIQRRALADVADSIGTVKEEGSVIMLTAQGEVVPKADMSSSHVMDEGGNLQRTESLLKVLQLRDRHSAERGKRFHVYPLRQFCPALNDGHDVTVGTILIAKYGDGRQKTYAVGRVTSISEGNTRQRSALLDKKSTTQRFVLELLDPVGDTRNGGQQYSPSGWTLSRVSGIDVLKIVNLLPLDDTRPGGHRDDMHATSQNIGLMPVEEVLEMNKKGFRRVTACGHVHVQTEAEADRDAENGFMPEASQISELSCFHCLTKWWHSGTGRIVKCTECLGSWHEGCLEPVQASGTVDEADFICAVCDDTFEEYCNKCRCWWTADDNEMLQCGGKGPRGCRKWFHQKCHNPVVLTVAKKGVVWVCSTCTVTERETELAKKNEGTNLRRSSRAVVRPTDYTPRTMDENHGTNFEQNTLTRVEKETTARKAPAKRRKTK